MNEKKKFRVHPRIQISLAVGISIIALAYFSKRVLPEPLSNLVLAVPPFLGTIWEAVAEKNRDARFARPLFGILLVLLATALVIGLNA